ALVGRVMRKEPLQLLPILVAHFGTSKKAVGQARDFRVVSGLFQQLIEVGVAFGIEQPQPREMSLAAELLRGGREKNEPANAAGEIFDEAILRADLLGGPLEMMGFVDDEQIPGRLEHLGGAGRVVDEKR